MKMACTEKSKSQTFVFLYAFFQISNQKEEIKYKRALNSMPPHNLWSGLYTPPPAVPGHSIHLGLQLQTQIIAR